MGRLSRFDQPLTYEELRDLDTYLVGAEQSQVRARLKKDVGLLSGRETISIIPNTGEIRTVSGKVVRPEELND